MRFGDIDAIPIAHGARSSSGTGRVVELINGCSR